MFDSILKDYNSKKSKLEKNKRNLSFSIVIPCLFIVSMKKELKELQEPLAKELLSNFNDVDDLFFYLLAYN